MDSMNEMTPFGMCLDSFSTQGKHVDLTADLKNISELGYEGFEMVAAFEGLTCPNKESFEQALKQYRLDPMCYTLRLSLAQVDACLHVPSTIPEAVLRHLQQARELGFPNVRLQKEWSEILIQTLLPAAMQYGVWLGMDLEWNQLLDLSTWKSSLEMIDTVGAKHVGFVLNWIPDNRFVTKQNLFDQTSSHEPLRRILPYVRILRLNIEDKMPDYKESVQNVLHLFSKHGFTGCVIYTSQPVDTVV